VLRIGESTWDGWLAAVWEGRGGMRKKNKGETEEESVGRGVVYIMAFTDGITDGIYPSVFPSVISSVTVPRHCTTISV